LWKTRGLYIAIHQNYLFSFVLKKTHFEIFSQLTIKITVDLFILARYRDRTVVVPLLFYGRLFYTVHRSWVNVRHRPPFSVHRSPFTVFRNLFLNSCSPLPFTVHRPPFTVHRPPFTVFSNLFLIILLVKFSKKIFF